MHRPRPLQTLLQKSLLIAWSVLCVTLFVAYPGIVSHIHQFFRFGVWQDFPVELARVEPLSYIGNIAGSLVGVVIFSISYISLGLLCLRLLKINLSGQAHHLFESLAQGCTAFVLGRAVLSLIFLLLAGLYKITPEYVALVLLASFLAGLRFLGEFISSLYRQQKTADASKQSMSWFDKLILGLSIALIILSLMYSSARLSYDAVAVYFSNAKITALTQNILFFSNDAFTASAFQDGIQYAAIIQVFGDQASRLYSWINGIVIIILSLALAEKLGLSTRARLFFLALLFTTNAFVDLLGDGKIDLASSAPIVAAVYWIVTNLENRQKNILLLTGFLAGMGMISRPYNIFLESVFIGVFYLLHEFFRGEKSNINIKNLFNTALWLAPGMIVLLGYLLLANWIIAGNPLSPLLNMLNYKLDDWGGLFDRNTIWIARVFYLPVITFLNSSHSLGTISPLFLAFIPTVFIADIRKQIQLSMVSRQIFAAAIITIILWIIFFFTVLEIRYILFLWIILFMMGAKIFESMNDSKNSLFRNLFKLIVLSILVFMTFRTPYIALATYSPIDKLGAPHCYESYYCSFLEPVNQTAEPGDRVLALSAYRYYLRPDLFSCSSKHEEYLALETLSTESNTLFWEEIYRQGYKFITYEQNYSQVHLHLGIIPNPQNTPSWLTLKPIATPIYQENGKFEASYQIIVNNPPISMEKTCSLTENGSWQVGPIKQLAP